MAMTPIQLLKQATPGQRRTLVAAALGWMLDSFDAMLYALVLTHVMRDLGMTKGTAGFLSTLMLLASGIGGILFGFLADRIGRKRALMLSIVTYSICSFASGLSTTVLMLAIVRFILGLGMGGEWNTGDPRRRNLARRPSRQGDGHRPELVGDWICAGSACRRHSSSLYELANGVFCRSPARCRYALDSESRAGV